MTLCEPTVQHFLLLAHSYSHRKGLSVCHNQTSVCSKTSTAPLETHSLDPCKQPAFCWVQFLQNGKLEARSPTPAFSSIHLSVKIRGFWKFPLVQVCLLYWTLLALSCHAFPFCKWLFVQTGALLLSKCVCVCVCACTSYAAEITKTTSCLFAKQASSVIKDCYTCMCSSSVWFLLLLFLLVLW